MKKAATARAIWKNPRQETGQVVVVYSYAEISELVLRLRHQAGDAVLQR